MKRILLGLILALLASPAFAQLPVCNNGDMIYRGSSGYQCVPFSNTAGPFLQSNGGAAAPTWSNQAATAFRLPPQTTNTFLGNSTGSTASPTPNTVSNILDTIGYDIARPPAPGAVIYKSAVAPNNAWQTLAPGIAGTVLTSGGAANPPFWTSTGQAALTAICTTIGAVLYYDTPSLSWQCLSPGTAGQLLQTGGAGANPTWTTPFPVGSVFFAGATGALDTDPAISWDDTLKKFNLNFSGTAMAPAETNTQFQMDGSDGFATTIFMDSHGATAAIDFRQQGGTKAAPTATATGATMGQINFQGWDGTAYGKNARVRATAEPSGATWTLTDHGVGVGIFTTAPGTLLLTEKFHVFGNGGATLGAALTNEGAGTLNLAALYTNNTLVIDSSGNVTGTTLSSASTLTLGANGGSAGQIIARGSTSGAATITAQAAAGTPALLWPTTSGTLASSGTSPIVVNATTGAVSCPTCNVTGSNVASVSNADGTLTISPTTGVVVASLNLSQANTWLSTQTLPSPILTGHPTVEGVTSTGATGTLKFVFSASPTFTGSPILAAPSATTLIVGSSTTLPSPAVVVVTANATTLPNPATGTVLHLSAANGAPTGAVIDAFANQPSFTFRRANTSAAAPSAVQSGEVMMTFGAIGYGATGYAGSARMQITGKATENWSDTAQGTSLQFNTTPNTTVTPALALLIQNSGGVSIGTSTDLGIGTLLANSVIKSLSSTASTSSTTGSGLFGGGLGVAGAIYAGSEITTGAVAVASLPTCNAAHKASRHFVTDANATFTAGIGAVVAAGGANNVPVTCDGTNWRIG